MDSAHGERSAMMRDVDRMEIARKLRECADMPDVWLQDTLPQFYIEKCIFGDLTQHGEDELFDRLAHLIDPTCEAHRDALFYPATDLTPENEEIVYRCDECGEIVSFDEDYDPETDLPAYCLRCGSRITGIGEPWQG